MSGMNKTICNICGCPREVTFKEQDHETGKIREGRHTVECGGHQGIHPALWNKSGGNSTGGVRSLGYSDYETFYQKLAKERPSVPRQNQEGIEDIGKRKEAKRQERRARKNRAQSPWKKRVFPIRKGKTGGVRGKSSERRGR